MTTRIQNIYFMVGHGEKKYQVAKNYIAGEGYGVKDLDLLKVGLIPEDCAQLIISGPQIDLVAKEIQLLEKYLAQGGRLMLLVDYPPKKALLPNLTIFLNKWGIGIEDSVVVELERRSLFDVTMVIPSYKNHAITNKLIREKINAVLPVNRGLYQLKDYQGQAVLTTILESSSNSWAETNPQGEVEKNVTETVGPIPLGIVATLVNKEKEKGNKEKKEPNSATKNGEGRLIVLGTASFLNDNMASQAGNLNLFYNMIQWLLNQEERISITPKQMDLTRVTLNPSQGNLIRVLTIFILPLVIITMGGVIWFRRRAR